jgi:RNA polymerase sigma factor (sigma-70 family)
VPRQDAADVIQEVFLTVFEDIGTFTKDGKPRAFRRWLYAITRYKVLNYWKKQRNAHVSASWIDEAPDSGPPPDDSSASRPDPRTLLESVLSDWIAFSKRVIEKHSAEEVARELGIPPSEVALAVSRVLKRLREEDEDGVPVGVLVLRGLLELIELRPEFEAQTFRAFRRVAVDGCPVDYVANELRMKVGSVHTAISRVRKRLKQEFKALGLALDEGKTAATDRAAVPHSEVTS